MLLQGNLTLSALASLAIVIVLVLLAARGVRASGLARRGVARQARLVLQDSLALDRVRRLQIVRCDGRDVMLLTGGGADIVVGWLAPPAIASGDPA